MTIEQGFSEGHFRLFSYEQLVRECVGLSRALNDNSLDSDSGMARMLLERVLVEMRMQRAKNVRLQRDIEGFLNGASENETRTEQVHHKVGCPQFPNQWDDPGGPCTCGADSQMNGGVNADGM